MKFKRLFTVATALILTFGVAAGSLAGSGLAAEASGPDLTVDAMKGRHAISPDIYGINTYAIDRGIFNDVPIPVERRGGNHTSHYNWLVDSGNAGSDYFFMGGNGQLNPVPGKEVDDMVSFDGAHGAKSVNTIPITGFVNKYSYDNCSYPESIYPHQGLQWWAFEFNPWVRWMVDPPNNSPQGDRCGSGLDPEQWQQGKQLTDINPDLNYLRVDSNWMKDWIRHLVDTHGTAAQGGLQIYQMDNEPESWSHIHHDALPDGAGFDQVLNQTIDYASAIKEVDPSAQILGPSNWGPPAYWDMNKPGDNRESHGGTPWYEYYLTKLKEREQQTGTRLLHYFDQHYYPGVDGASIANSGIGDEFTQKARLRSTRVLWDPTYNQENWMGTWFPDTYGKLALIPRMKTWVDQYYPGTKTAITEYNWGGLESMNGALAQADVLGIFGREGLDLATLWGPPKATDPGAYAFRMYLNYDGNGGKYGDTWVESSSADQSQLAIYSSQRSSDGALTMMVMNKTDSDLNSNVTIGQYKVNKKEAEVYQYSGANLSAIEKKANIPVDKLTGKEHNAVPDSQISYKFPANSITLFVVEGHTVPGAVNEPGSGKPGAGLQNGTVPSDRGNNDNAAAAKANINPIFGPEGPKKGWKYPNLKR